MNWALRILEHIVQNYAALDNKSALLHLLVRLNMAFLVSVPTEFLSQVIRMSLADAKCLKYALALTYNQAIDDESGKGQMKEFAGEQANTVLRCCSKQVITYVISELLDVIGLLDYQDIIIMLSLLDQQIRCVLRIDDSQKEC